MSVAMLRSDIIKAISEVEDEGLLQEIGLILKQYSDTSNKGNEIGNILGQVDFEELTRQLNEPEEELSWEEVKKQLKSFS